MAMAKKKTGGNVYVEIKDAAKARVDKLTELESQLAAAEREKDNCEARATKALQSDSAEEYASAKSAGRSAADKAEFFKIKITELETAPLFSDSELTRIKKEIREAIEIEKDDKFFIAIQKAQEAYEIFDGFIEYLNTANAALKSAYIGRQQSAAAISVIDYVGPRNALFSLLNTPIIKSYLKK